MDDVSFLEGLLRHYSPSGAEDNVAAYLMEQMAARGFRVRRDEVGNVLGEIGDPAAPRLIVLLGHMDTVPGVIPVRYEDGQLYGRGAVDAKGPLAAFVLAAERAAPALREARVLVVGAVDEERESRGAHHLVEQVHPDFAVIGEPSGWEGITLGYKGSLTVRYRLTRPAGHGAAGRPAPAEEAVVFWNRLTAYAEAFNQAQNPPVDRRAFAALTPSLRAIRTFGDGLSEGVEMTVNLRLPPGLDQEALREEMLAWADGAEVSFPYAEPPFRASRNTPLVRAFLRAIRAAGGRPRFKLKTGTSDMNVVGPAWGCPIVAYGPGDSYLDHTPDEHISVDEFRRSTDVLARVLVDLG